MKRSIQSIIDTDVKSHRTYFINKNMKEYIIENYNIYIKKYTNNTTNFFYLNK